MIIIKFSDNIPHRYKSFDKILKLDNYNDIIYLDCSCNNLSGLSNLPKLLEDLNCSNNNLSSLPKLPNSLKILWCNYNKISDLPNLPSSLIELHCTNNNLFSLPELSNSLIKLQCGNNNLSSLPKLPNSLTNLRCTYNNLSSLPELPNSITFINYCHNPIYIYIYKYFNDNYIEYNEYQKKMKKVFAIKIGDWFLECRYNPKYKYCRKRLMKEYEECYGASPYIRRTMI